MDAQTISAAAGTGVLALKVSAMYIQSRFPDSTRIRNINIPTMAISSISYAAMRQSGGAILYGTSALRSAIRTTKWGAENKQLLGAFMSAAMGIYTAASYESPSDVMPVMCFTIGTAGDMSAQGRRMRLAFFTAMSLAAPYAFLKGNFMMATAESLSASLMAKAIFAHDIKGASGTNSKIKDLKAYIHGVFTNSATGAAPETQVNTDRLNEKAPEDLIIIQQKYRTNLQQRPNPHYIQPTAYI